MKIKRRLNRAAAIALCALLAIGCEIPASAKQSTDAAGDGMLHGESFVTDHYTLKLELDPDVRTGRIAMGNPYEDQYYNEGYWKTINLNRIPGTTVINSEDKVQSMNGLEPENTLTSSDWIGGTTNLLQTSIRGIEYIGGDVEGNQSYFLFDNQIMCMGAGLHNTSKDAPQAGLVTVLENFKLKPKLDDTWICMDYNTRRASAWLGQFDDKKGNTRKTDMIYNQSNGGYATANSWVYLSQGNGTGIGYYFPKASMGKAEYRFAQNSASDGSAEHTWYELWLNHGTSSDVSYEYVILPNVSGQASVQAEWSQPSGIVLENSKKIQAAYHKPSNTVGANFWSEEGGRLTNDFMSDMESDGKASILMKESGGKLYLSVSDPSKTEDQLKIRVSVKGYSVVQASSQITADCDVEPDTVVFTVDLSAHTGDTYHAVINITPESIEPDTQTIQIVKGNTVTLPLPEGMAKDQAEWTCSFLKEDGTTVNNAGYSKYKRELKDGESEGRRKAGPANVEHLARIEKLADGRGLLTGVQMGGFSVVVSDGQGNRKTWDVRVHALDEKDMVQAAPKDYQLIRERWKESLVGINLSDSQEGQTFRKELEEEAARIWNSYQYKGLGICSGIPWPEEVDTNGYAGNPDIRFEDDAVEFRLVVQNLLAMAKAYQAEGGIYYKNAELLSDMIAILDWFSKNCYTPKTQTDNWWTWEIGIPKDLVPLLVLLSDDLTADQKKLYCGGILFFQPDPFHEGIVGEASTHAQGYRDNSGANLLDCSVIALGTGAVLEDRELISLAQRASISQYVLHTVPDSTLVSSKGYESGFYEDGSYLDHSYVPYTGSYGIEFFRGGVNLSILLKGTPWQYDEKTMRILERYVIDGFGSSMYQGLMLNSLMGRSIGRNHAGSRTIGREVMRLVLKFMDVAGVQAQLEIKPLLKNWLTEDEGFLDTLTDAEGLVIKQKAQKLLSDGSISPYLNPFHKNMAVMDRAVHRRDHYLFNISMFSSRIQNCEIMNGENLYGWHTGDGMTYLYNQDDTQFSSNYFNTVNPYRLAGTTVVPVLIGNGEKDSSGFYQEGDYRSYEDWVGGTSLGAYGINGMSLSGMTTSDKVIYAPELRAKKSWFMFDDEIVCLGSGIHNSSDTYATETIVENRKLRADASNRLIVNGMEKELYLKPVDVKAMVNHKEDTSGIILKDVDWAHLEGNVEGSDIGYYFPGTAKQLQVRKTANTGNWADIGTTQGINTENYLELWFDHGKNPSDETYEYVLLPGKTAEETGQYAASPQVKVLKNTPQVQAVYHQQLKLTGANFWTDTRQTAGRITVGQKASVMMQEDDTDGTLTISIADPTMKNTKVIEVEVQMPITEILSKDDNIEVEKLDDGFLCRVSVKGTNGSASNIKVRMAQ